MTNGSDAVTASGRPRIPRVLPALTEDNRHFWTGGQDGELRFLRCSGCLLLVHPPAPVCRGCRSMELAPATVPGTGTVLTFTVNHHSWSGQGDEPYVIAIVELDAQPGLRLTTNIVGCPIDAVRFGMRVVVEFEHRDGVWFPLFRPLDASTSGSAESEDVP